MGLNLRVASLSAIFVLVVASIPCDARIFHATVDRTTSMEQTLQSRGGRRLQQLDPSFITDLITSFFTFFIPQLSFDPATNSFSISNSASFGSTTWNASSTFDLPTMSNGSVTWGSDTTLKGATTGLFGEEYGVYYTGQDQGFAGNNTIKGTYQEKQGFELAATNTSGIVQNGNLNLNGDLNSIKFDAKGKTSVATGYEGAEQVLPIDVSVGPLATPGLVPTTLFGK